MRRCPTDRRARHPLRAHARRLTGWLATALLVCAAAAHSQAERARAAIDRAIGLIDAGEYSLARSYLALPLIDARIHSTERSRAYYLHGFSRAQQGLYVGAALDYAKALAFNPDNPATLAALGHLTLNGLGLAKDVPQALSLLRRGAELGHAPAQAAYGSALLRERDDLAEARRWLQRALDGGETQALLGLAESHRPPHPDPDPQRARELYLEAATAGVDAAYTRLGHLHLGNELDAPDPAAAQGYFQAGAEAGESGSALMLGYLLATSSDRGTPQALASAGDWLQRAHAAGEARAAGLLAYVADRRGDPDAARMWRERAAANGDRDALTTLSQQAFEDGDTRRGISLLRRAVDNGAIEVSNQLAWRLATASDPALRDGNLAVRYAQVAITHARDANSLDTLAAAYAAAGRFADAVGAQTQALGLLNDAEELAAEFRERLQRYESGRAYVEDANAVQPAPERQSADLPQGGHGLSFAAPEHTAGTDR